jgi:ribosomal protein S18 acetylase RimI-like enzyme
MEIRTAVPEDALAVTALMKSVGGVWQDDWRSDSVARSIAAADGLALVAVDDGQVIGFLSGHDVGFRAYLGEFVISEDHQRAGIGSAMLKKLENSLAERNCGLAVADVYPPAAAFYRARGWEAPTAVLLARRLSK